MKKRAALLHVLAFSALDHLFGVPRGEHLAAHNERRQFAAQTRSCGYSPRWGEHCSLPGFAALNRGPLLATPQSPKPGSAASQQRDFSASLLVTKEKDWRAEAHYKRVPRRGGGIGACAGALGCIRKTTIPQSALSRSQLPLHKGAFSKPPCTRGPLLYPRS